MARQALQQRRSANFAPVEVGGVRTIEDRRITRSKLALRRALIELMETRGFDAITVNDLCAAADLNRTTFYNHFSTKEECLESFEGQVFADLEEIQKEIQHLSLLDISRAYLGKKPLPFLVRLYEYLYEQGDFLHAVMGPGGDIRFAPRLRAAICTNLIERVLHERYRNSTDPLVGYYVSFFASAYLGVIQKWLETGMQESPEYMARVAVRLLFIKPGESIKL